MKECNHPNVVKLKEVINDLKFDKILLILEYCKFGEIDWKRYNHYYEKYKPMENSRSPLTLNKILRDVINGLEYLHDYKHIIHRDLKPSNLLINYDNTIKISDFGVSLILENNANDAKELGKIIGTPAFYAPELCQFVNNRYSMITNEDHVGNKIRIDCGIDIWSLGVTLYCLMFNNLPFNGNNEFDMFQKIVKSELTFPMIKCTSKTTDEDIEELKVFKKLIKRILVKDPDERISLQEIKLDEFTTFDLNELQKKKFLNFNKAIFKDQDCKKLQQQPPPVPSSPVIPSPSTSHSSFSTRIKKFFGNSPTSKKSVSAPSASPTNTPKIKPTNGKLVPNLEHVDDLLDSYLDDSSSSMGSIIEGEDNDPIDTTNILGNLDTDLSFEPQQQQQTKRSSLPPITPPPKSPTKQKQKPKPLDLKASIILKPPAPPKQSQINASPTTPTNGTIKIIGESSPNTNSQFFSPSKRYFENQKKVHHHHHHHQHNSPKIGENSVKYSNAYYTISSLASPMDKTDSSNSTNLNNINGNKQKNSNSSSRRNSNSSQHNNNNFGYGLNRITSSSSSLNLNAYLTDDSTDNESQSIRSISTRYNLRKKNSQILKGKEEVKFELEDESDKDGEDGEVVEGDSTIIGKEYQVLKNYNSMSDYLDSLE
ncbi:ssp1 Serine/threonine-protein kinase ssp1 [Candida maltosa Xu316]